MIKLAEFVINFLSENGVRAIFGISGGASLHLIHAVNADPNVGFFCPHHEQGAAMAADGYSRSTGGIGVAIATSGPGATNMITGICCSYYDSIPVLYITGQVSTFRQVGPTGVRQIGFQETPIIDVVRSITKYGVTVTDPLRIKYEMQKAISIAKADRPGPVLIDIPDDIQRELIDVDKLVEFVPPILQVAPKILAHQIKEVILAIAKAERPVIIVGWGVVLSGTQEELRRFARGFNIPVAATWGASNILSSDDPLYIGTFGTHGMRSANFAVQNADLVISLGSRLDTKATGTPISSFAREATKIVVDIDEFELRKFSHFDLIVDILVQADLREFFVVAKQFLIADHVRKYEGWRSSLAEWRTIDAVDDTARSVEGINPYNLFLIFASQVKPLSKIFIDTGCSIAWAMQAAKFSQEHTVFHDFNNTAMGWALPASVGSLVADLSVAHYCIIGDGGFMMTIQELSMVAHHKLPLKIIVINNSGYSMIKQTQEQWFDNDYVASGIDDISFPEFETIALGFGISFIRLSDPEEITTTLNYVNECDGPVMCEVIISPDARVIPQVKAGRANEDMEPLLPRNVFNDAMLICPESRSR